MTRNQRWPTMREFIQANRQSQKKRVITPLYFSASFNCNHYSTFDYPLLISKDYHNCVVINYHNYPKENYENCVVDRKVK